MLAPACCDAHVCISDALVPLLVADSVFNTLSLLLLLSLLQVLALLMPLLLLLLPLVLMSAHDCGAVPACGSINTAVLLATLRWCALEECVLSGCWTGAAVCNSSSSSELSCWCRHTLAACCCSLCRAVRCLLVLTWSLLGCAVDWGVDRSCSVNIEQNSGG
jgi:hypothetical protein